MRACALVLCGAGLLAGCGGTIRYPEAAEKNLHIRIETSSGSAFSSVKAVLGVHAVDARCGLKYEGMVALDRPQVQVGIPADRLSYLVFEFASSSFLGGSRGSIAYETLLRPRVGRSYEVRVSYKNDIYDVVIRERGKAGREIDRAGLAACRRQVVPSNSR